MLVSGVLLSKLPSRIFPIPYYTTTLAAQCVANLALLFLSTVLPESTNLGFTYTFSVTVVAAPLMAFSIVGLATVRGELKALWVYKETWGLPDAPRERGNSAKPPLMRRV